MVSIIGATHPGIREHNEDCFAADSVNGIGLVADGMGGYACGEIASQLVKQTVLRALGNEEGLKEAIARAHAVVKVAANRDKEKQGMGSTVVALKVAGADYEVAWVGDSRAYLWDGSLKQITRDHSYVENLIAKGVITPTEAIKHPSRHLITQAVGVAGDEGLEISIVRGRLQGQQQLLLCSDGLVDEVADRDIARLMNDAGDEETAVNNLIEAAVAAGGHDNITVLIATADPLENELPAIVPDIIRITHLDDREEEICARPTIEFSGNINDINQFVFNVSKLAGLFRLHSTAILLFLIVILFFVSLALYFL